MLDKQSTQFGVVVKSSNYITCEKADSQLRLLLCDGYDSYRRGDFLHHCMNNNIASLIIPPHSSHFIPLLDISIFGPLKTARSKECDRIRRTGVRKI